jgi:hypothetical protein
MNVGRKILIALGAALTIAAAGASPTLACSDRLEGQPANLQPGGDLGYYLWLDGTGFHLRTTGPGDRHVFDARLETGGVFQNVQPVGAEAEDTVNVGPDQHVMELHFVTFDHLDGVDFTIDNGHRLLVTLNRDGALSPTDQIYLGQNDEHPLLNPFLGLCTDRLVGRPANLHPGGDTGFYIWRDGDGFHLVVTGPRNESHLYTARLETGGTFQNVQTARAETGDAFTLGPDGHVLDLHFQNHGLLDGINFDVANGQRLLFSLQRDGVQIGTDQIYLGGNSEHPELNPFIQIWE